MVTIQKRKRMSERYRTCNPKFQFSDRITEKQKTVTIIQLRDPRITASQQALKDSTNSHFCKQKSYSFSHAFPIPSTSASAAPDSQATSERYYSKESKESQASLNTHSKKTTDNTAT